MADPNSPLPESLQEAVLAVLALDADHGPVIAGQVRAEHFSGALHDAAIAVLAYHRQYHKAPGEAQLFPVMAAGREGDRAAGVRRLAGRLVATAVTLNPAYVVTRVSDLVRHQTLLTATNEAMNLFLASTDEGGNTASEVEAILRAALDARRTPMDAGTFLSDASRSLRFLERREATYRLGIEPLDRAGIGLTAKESLLYIAPKNSGKTWFCVHCGRQALMQGAKVVHLTLEDYEQTIGRYYQSMFGMAWKDENFLHATLEFDDLDRLSGFKSDRKRPRKAFSSPGARTWLRERIKHWGTRLGRLVVKEYSSGSLTMNEVEGYLDYLESAENFVPHVLIIDYPDLMKLDRRNYRLELGQLYVEIRGLLQRRNLAGVTPTQGNRSSLRSATVHSDQISEDVSKVFTADTVLTYSQTESEERLGLARLHVDYARHAERGQTVLITQSYPTGQYVLQAALMRQAYWDRLKEVSGEGAGTGED